MKTFDLLTQDEQMDAVDAAKLSLASSLMKHGVVLSLIPYDKDILVILNTIGRAHASSPNEFFQHMEYLPNLKIAFLHEAGRIAKRATYGH